MFESGRNNLANTRNVDERDEESQSISTSNVTRNIDSNTLPNIHNWQLLSPIKWSYCRYSSQPKPPRSHYDHVTTCLVLNMDHYCPWMFNCIGYFSTMLQDTNGFKFLEDPFAVNSLKCLCSILPRKLQNRFWTSWVLLSEVSQIIYLSMDGYPAIVF